uniref:PDZ domain-containing protein n=1 Tax=Ciona savignyi TaxID=51511 RepID=H2Y4S2_CIOSA
MGAENTATVCEGSIEKKVDRRLPIGPAWKRKFCVLDGEALRFYGGSSSKREGRCHRTLPLCHIKKVVKIHEEGSTNTRYFNVETEQGETMMFRCKERIGWVAQIQIQLIHYKNRQDIIRYKQLNNSILATEGAMQRLRSSSLNHDVTSNHVIEGRSRGCRRVELPNHRNSGTGIGITVIPLSDGKIVVNRVLDGGPAMRLGGINPRDQIVAANGLRVTSVEMLSEVVRDSPESVTLLIKPRICKSPSPVPDDPKALLHKDMENKPEYINTDDRTSLEKGFLRRSSRERSSPRHFKFF